MHCTACVLASGIGLRASCSCKRHVVMAAYLLPPSSADCPVLCMQQAAGGMSTSTLLGVQQKRIHGTCHLRTSFLGSSQVAARRSSEMMAMLGGCWLTFAHCLTPKRRT